VIYRTRWRESNLRVCQVPRRKTPDRPLQDRSGAIPARHSFSYPLDYHKCRPFDQPILVLRGPSRECHPHLLFRIFVTVEQHMTNQLSSFRITQAIRRKRIHGSWFHKLPTQGLQKSRGHLLRRGFMTNYMVWTKHGEEGYNPPWKLYVWCW
jgi:hypothetical protein